MSTPFQLSLLRRTFAAFAAATSLLAIHEAAAQTAGTVTLSGTSGNSCNYSALSVNPSGGVTVTCSGGGTPPPANTAGAFSWTAGTATNAANSNAQATIQRTGGTLGAYDIYYWYEGAGCAHSEVAGPVKFGDGDAANKSVAIPMGRSGVCTVGIGAPPSPATIGANRFIAISVSSIPDPPSPPSGCAATPTGMLTNAFGGLGNVLLQMQGSGQVVAIKVPNLGNRSTGQVSFGESAGGAYSPQPVTIEISINKCPGVIDTDYNNFCNLRSTNGNYNSITWMGKSYSSINAGNVQQYGYCWAGEPGTQYYINARWTYASCAFGAQVCGFAVQYNEGPY